MDALSLRLDTPPLELRVGHDSQGGAARTVGRQGCLAQRYDSGGDNPWALDALLVVAEQTGGRDDVAPGGLVLGALRECMWELSAADEEPTLLLPELLAAVDARCEVGGERRLLPNRARLSLMFVKRGSFYVAREGSAPLYLLRGDGLRELADSPGIEANSRKSHALSVETGALEDGDALLCANVDLTRWLRAEEIRRCLQQSLSPRAAAARLAEQAQERGAPDPAVGVLFAGVGPGSTPRPERTGSFVELQPSPPPPPPSPIAPARSAAPPRAGVSMGAVAAGLAGALLGIGGGVALVVTLLRPGGEPPTIRAQVLDAPPTYAAPTPSPASSRDSDPRPTGSTTTPPSPPPAQPVATGGTSDLPSPGTRTPRLPARTTSTAPPVVPLASGMSSRVTLRISLDGSQGLLLFSSNQGALFSPEAPKGVAAGTSLPLPLEPALRDRLADGRGELRLMPVGGGGLTFAVRDDDLGRLLQGEVITVVGVPPGDYRLAAAHPDQEPLISETSLLRVGGI